jgi:hypothetical protein
MSNGDLLSLLINLVVGVYFIHFFPKRLKQQMPTMPPLFALLYRFIPIVGYLLIIASVIYAFLLLTGQTL